MKKLLGIVVLGLLLSGNVYAKPKTSFKERYALTKTNNYVYMSHAKDWPSMGKKRYGNFVAGGSTEEQAKSNALEKCQNYIKQQNLNVTCFTVHMFTNGKKIAKEKKATSQQTVKVKKIDLTSIKQTCLNFGYVEGTEKLADCMKEIYLKQTEQVTIIQNTNTSNAKPKRKIDPTVWDDLLKLGGISSGSSSSSSSSSSSLKSTCYNTGEETGGMNKSCKYSCSGNIVTTTISSLEICPVKIQR